MIHSVYINTRFKILSRCKRLIFIKIFFFLEMDSTFIRNNRHATLYIKQGTKKVVEKNDRLEVGYSLDFEGWQHVRGRTIKWEINSARPVFNAFYALQLYSRYTPIHALEMAYTRFEYAIWIFRRGCSHDYTRDPCICPTHRDHFYSLLFSIKHRGDYLSIIPWLNNIFLEGWKMVDNNTTRVLYFYLYEISRGKNYTCSCGI